MISIYINYDFDNWNTYINKERSNKFWASSVKKKELDIIRYSTLNIKPINEYPVKLTFTKYFQDKRQDLDNVRIKGIIDGLVKCGILKNDNLNCITEIVLKAEFSDEKDGILVEIERK